MAPARLLVPRPGACVPHDWAKSSEKSALASRLQSLVGVRPLLPIALLLPIVACSSSTPPSSAVGTATATGSVVDGGGHSVPVGVVLPAADAATRRYAFWG